MKLNSSQNVGFTSDLHLFHHNIIRLSNRPFTDVLGMNETLRDNHNAVFDKDSIVFNLGDAILAPRTATIQQAEELAKQIESILSTYKGTIYYVPGNHERDIRLILNYWIELPQLVDLKVENQDIVLCHYGLRTWNKAHHGSWHLYGHSHGGLMDDNGVLMHNNPKSLSLDVGVDNNDYKPFTYEQVKAYMSSRVFRPNDHHSGKMNK